MLGKPSLCTLPLCINSTAEGGIFEFVTQAWAYNEWWGWVRGAEAALGIGFSDGSPTMGAMLAAGFLDSPQRPPVQTLIMHFDSGWNGNIQKRVLFRRKEQVLSYSMYCEYDL